MNKKYYFKDLVIEKGGFLRGPFGGDLKKEMFVEKSDETYKVYEQGVVLREDKSIGNYYISKKDYDNGLKKFNVQNRDFLVSCSGVNMGAIFQLNEPFEKGIINQALLRIRLNNKLIDDNYFFYLFKELISKKITRGSGDSTIPNFPPLDYVKKVELEIPVKEVQKKIGIVLSKIDAKISLNNRVNTELEQMAKTIYNYWFVQFDFPNEEGKPYKTSGGEMVWNEELKRDIPIGWEVKSLYDIAIYTNGLAMQNHRPTSVNSLPVIKIKEMNEGYSNATEFAKSDFEDNYIVYEGDVLFSWSASLNVMLWADKKGALNQHIFKVTSNEYPRYYFYHQIVNYLNHFKQMAANRKTTMGHITKDHLIESRICVPDDKTIIEKCGKQVEDILNLLVKNKMQNHELMAQRDFLLPLLMNGQVKIKEDEWQSQRNRL
jgi:type I restriction enzyme, S subunit